MPFKRNKYYPSYFSSAKDYSIYLKCLSTVEVNDIVLYYVTCLYDDERACQLSLQSKDSKLKAAIVVRANKSMEYGDLSSHITIGNNCNSLLERSAYRVDGFPHLRFMYYLDQSIWVKSIIKDEKNEEKYLQSIRDNTFV